MVYTFIMKINQAAVDFTESNVEHVKNIVAPLLTYCDITYFSTVRYFFDGRSVALTTKHDVTEMMWKYKYYLRRQDLEECSEYRMFSRHQSGRNEKVCELLGINHLILCTNKFEQYFEVNCFGTNQPVEKMVDFYLNNVDLLKLYSNYFRDKTMGLFEQGANTPFYLDDFNLGFITDEKKHNCLNILETKVKADHLVETYKLSPREIECMKMLSEGKSVKEIAKELNLSPNTIKFYIKNLKQKVNCTKVAEIIKVFYSQQCNCQHHS
jgi:LuxR family quorum-sensing system transcriptional regulator SolR